MSVTILEALQCADHNIRKNGQMGLFLAKDQLHNATVLLERGYDLYTEVEPLLQQHGAVENVPEQEEHHD